MTAGAADAPARQQTLRATIGWSYSLLDEEAHWLMRRLSVFRGGWTIDAVEAISPAGADALGNLDTLVSQCLVLRDDGSTGTRFRMLEAVRAFGIEQLQRGDALLEASEQHAAYYLDLAERLDHGHDSQLHPERISRLAAEHDNLRAALTWLADQRDADKLLRFASALGFFWYVRGHLREGRSWLDRALALAGKALPTRQAYALFRDAHLAHELGDLEVARRRFETALALYQSVPDALGIANTLNGLGIVQGRLGDLAGANAYLSESLEVFRELEDSSMISLVSVVIAYVALLQGDRDQAVVHADEGLRIARDLDDEWNVASALLIKGYLALDDGKPDDALALLRESLAISLQLDDLRGAAFSVESLAAVHADQGRIEAAWLAGVAATIREKSGHTLSAIESAWYERYLELASREIDDETWNTAWTAGRVAPYAEAMQRAMGESVFLPEATLAPPPGAQLSPRELEILRLVVDGLSNQEIAAALFISHRTVASHVGNILNKLGLDSRTAAAAWAVRHGIA